LGATALLVLAAAGCGSSAHPAPEARSGPPLQTIFEDTGSLLRDPVGTLDTLRRLGVDRVKVFIYWDRIAPQPDAPQPPAGFQATDPAAYPAAGWAPYDTIIRDAKARAIGVDLTLGPPPPDWAAGAGAPQPSLHSQWKPSPRAFEAFVRAVGARYSGTYIPPGQTTALPRVDFWSIWNEPNFGPELAPQSAAGNQVEVSPALYARLLDAAWSGLHATGHGADTILIGEVAPSGITTGDNPGTFGFMVPLRFIRALYCVDQSFRPLTGAAARARSCPTTRAGSSRFRATHPALFDAAGFADHPYPQGGIPPNEPTPGEPDFAELAAIPALEQTLAGAMQAYGSRARLPIWSTEFGYQTDPPETIANTTDPGTAASYLNWSEYISWLNPQLRSYDQFLLRDPATAGPNGGFASGLEFADGSRKPTYAAFRMPLFLPHTHGNPLEVWGCVRPARYAWLDTGVTQRVEIQLQQRAGGPFRIVRTVTLTDPYGYFDVVVRFPGSGNVRTAWAYPHGEHIHSRSIAIQVG
jgi:hypothetical protein